ncbi:MAG: hypothetical protein H7A45_03940 [Verrucomicrobiales bacterium]|nr:hypothetical protein [Verrucomicrobiales bacterium]
MASLVLAGGAAGCRTYHNQSAAMREAWIQGDFERAAQGYQARADGKDGRADGVIWSLEAGASLRAVGDYTNSNVEFARAAAQIEAYEQKAKVRVGNTLGATLTTQQNLPYEGRSYDKIMLHTYRALNYLALGQVDAARPEIIRAYQRQQDAVAENARRIEAAREAEANNPHRPQIEAARNDPALAAQLEALNRPPEGFQFYADYVNPFTVYLDGLYFRHAGAGGSDLERARKSFARVIETAGGNPAVAADLKECESAIGPRRDALTYVLLENGQAASLNQVRIDIPIIFANVSYVGAAFPTLEYHPDRLAHLRLETAAGPVTTAPLASMDSVVAQEFRNEWPAILTRTLISAVVKGAASYGIVSAARQQGDAAGLLAGIGTAILQAAVNVADTRSWTTLPKEWQVARFPTPPDRVVVLRTPDGRTASVPLIDGVVNVVYVRAVTAVGPLKIGQFRLR